MLDRKNNLEIRLKRVTIGDKVFFDRPLIDNMSYSIALKIHNNFGFYKASDLVGLHYSFFDNSPYVSRQSKRMLSDLIWYLEFKLDPYDEDTERYLSKPPSVLDYLEKNTKLHRVDIVMLYLKGFTIPLIEKMEKIKSSKIIDILEYFRSDYQFPWVEEDRYLLLFDQLPSRSEFFSLYPEATEVHYRYLRLMFRLNGKYLPVAE